MPSRHLRWLDKPLEKQINYSHVNLLQEFIAVAITSNEVGWTLLQYFDDDERIQHSSLSG